MRPWNQKIVVVLLIVCLLFCSFISCLPAPAYADTGSSTASKIAYISVLLAAVGVTVDNKFVVNPVAQGFLDFCSQSYQGALTALNAIKSTVGTGGTVLYPFMTNQEIYDALIAYKSALAAGNLTEFSFAYDTPMILGTYASPSGSRADVYPFGGSDVSKICSNRMINFIVSLGSGISGYNISANSSTSVLFTMGNTMSTTNYAYGQLKLSGYSSKNFHWYYSGTQAYSLVSGLTDWPSSFTVSYCPVATALGAAHGFYWNGSYVNSGDLGDIRNFLRLYQLKMSDDVVIPYTVSVSLSSAAAGDTWTDSISLQTGDITYSDGIGQDVLGQKSVAIPQSWLGTGTVDMVQPGSIAGQTATTLTETGVLSDTVVDPGTVDPPVVDTTTILGLLQAIWNWLQSLVSALASAIAAGIAAVFVPDPNFFDGKLDSLKDILIAKIGADGATSIFDLFKNATGGTFEDISMTYMGSTGVIVDADTVNFGIAALQGIIKAFVRVFLAFFVYNQMYFLIRGTYPIKIGRDSIEGGKGA